MKLFHFLTFASLSLWESRAKGPERVAAVLVVESIAGSENPPRPLRGRPSRTRLVVLHNSSPNQCADTNMAEDCLSRSDISPVAVGFQPTVVER